MILYVKLLACLSLKRKIYCIIHLCNSLCKTVSVLLYANLSSVACGKCYEPLTHLSYRSSIGHPCVYCLVLLLLHVQILMSSATHAYRVLISAPPRTLYVSFRFWNYQNIITSTIISCQCPTYKVALLVWSSKNVKRGL